MVINHRGYDLSMSSDLANIHMNFGMFLFSPSLSLLIDKMSFALVMLCNMCCLNSVRFMVIVKLYLFFENYDASCKQNLLRI